MSVIRKQLSDKISGVVVSSTLGEEFLVCHPMPVVNHIVISSSGEGARSRPSVISMTKEDAIALAEFILEQARTKEFHGETPSELPKVISLILDEDELFFMHHTLARWEALQMVSLGRVLMIDKLLHSSPIGQSREKWDALIEKMNNYARSVFPPDAIIDGL